MNRKSLKIALVGHDVQPSQSFALLQPVLEARGHTVIPHFMYGKDTPVFDPNILAPADVIAIGMSSSPAWATVEIAVAQIAQQSGKPFGFYSDIFRCHRRAWFGPFRDTASFIFAFNSADVSDARGFFPNATVFFTGNPTHASYFDSQASSGEVEEAFGLQDNDCVILVGGVKSFPMNVELIMAVINACRKMPNKPKVLFGLHPADSNSRGGYEALVRSIGELPIRFVTKAEMPSSQILCRANLFIESTGSLGIEAACKRKPVLSFLTARAHDLLIAESGEPVWTPVAQGTSCLVQNEYELAGAITDNELHGRLISRQCVVYPTPQGKGEALEKMATALEAQAHSAP